MTSGCHEGCELTRRDIQNPANPGVFEERYWSSSIRPLRGLDGQVEMLEFSAREVTPVIEQYERLKAERA